ncbi:MAG: hypothetical protein AAGA99_04600 [Actinomycetota bacterium]
MSATDGASLVLRPPRYARWWGNLLLAALIGTFVLFVVRPGAARAIVVIAVFLLVLPALLASMRRVVVDEQGLRFGWRQVRWDDVLTVDTAKAEVVTRHPRRYSLPGRVEPADLRPFAPDHVTFAQEARP